MPYYRWTAIDLEAQEYEGELWAPSIKQLEKELLHEHLGLMHAQRIKIARIERWSLAEQALFFETCAQLIQAGLLVSHVLQIMSKQGKTMQRRLAAELHQSVMHGSSFAEALYGYRTLFSPLAVSLIQSGQETGQLNEALVSVLDFLKMRVALGQKIRSALRVPLITFGFFIALCFIIFVAIVPSFEQLTSIVQQDGTALHRLLAWSAWLREISLIRVVLFVLSGAFGLWLLNRSPWFRAFKSWIVIKLPFIGDTYSSLSLSLFFQAVSLLIRGGKSLVEALNLAASLTANEYVGIQLNQLTHEVEGGSSLDEAYGETFGRSALPDVAALLAVGNETGTLDLMCKKSAQRYFERAEKRLKYFALLLQPLLMILMGALVALLIYAIYVPLMQLPEIMSTI